MKSKTASKVILITGCSSGIGKVTALHLNKTGFIVYATARRLETIKDLELAGCRILPLDVTREESMREALNAIQAQEGAVDILINNAGYSQSGALETVPIEALRQQFETNLFGLMRLTQMVLPAMRKQGWGRVINIGSMAGKMTLPGGGAYHASKYALEALSDVLRYEVKGFGIDVTLIEPGFIMTRFPETVFSEALIVDPDGAYHDFNRIVMDMTRRGYQDRLFTSIGGTPEQVARAIEKAVKSSHPPYRIPVTFSAHLLIFLHTLVPDWIWDWGLQMFYPHPHK